jgi:hypothetical protein
MRMRRRRDLPALANGNVVTLFHTESRGKVGCTTQTHSTLQTVRRQASRRARVHSAQAWRGRWHRQRESVAKRKRKSRKTLRSWLRCRG